MIQTLTLVKEIMIIEIMMEKGKITQDDLLMLNQEGIDLDRIILKVEVRRIALMNLVLMKMKILKWRICKIVKMII